MYFVVNHVKMADMVQYRLFNTTGIFLQLNGRVILEVRTDFKTYVHLDPRTTKIGTRLKTYKQAQQELSKYNTISCQCFSCIISINSNRNI